MARTARERKKEAQVISFDEERAKRRAAPAAKTAKAGAASKRKRRRSVFRGVYAIIFLALLATAAVYAVWIISLQSELDEVRAENTAALEKKARLETAFEHVGDPEYIEQQARTRLRMIKPGELLYVLPDAAGNEGGLSGGGLSAPPAGGSG
jgi:cell division protein FtsB